MWIDFAHFVMAIALAWQPTLKKTKIKLDLLNDIDMLLMIEKGIKGGTCHIIHRYVKANKKYMKDYDKNKELLYLKYCDGSNLCGRAMLQKLPVDGFKLVEKTFRFSKNLIENWNENSDEGSFFEVDFPYPKKLHELHNDLLLLITWKNKNSEG